MDINNNQECFVCQKHQGLFPVPGGFIFQNDLILISHATLWKEEKTHYLGHIFIETRRHIAELADLNEEESKAIGIYTQRISKAIMDILKMEHVYAFVIGDGMPHVHVHVIGRYPNTPREYWSTKVDEWPDAPKGDNQKMAEIALKIRNNFNKNYQNM